MAVPTSDVLRDRQIAEEIALQQEALQSYGQLGTIYLPGPELQAQTDRVLADLRAGTYLEPSSSVPISERLRDAGAAVAGAVAQVPRLVGQAVGGTLREVAAGVGSGLGAGGSLALVAFLAGVGLLAALALRRA